MANDWDLSAIVRSCSAVAAAAAANAGNDEVGINLVNLDGILTCGDYEDEGRNEVDDPLDELQHVYRPFYRKAQPGGASAATASDSAGGGSENKHRPAEYQSRMVKPEVPLQRQRVEGKAEEQRQRVEGKADDNGVGSHRRIPSQAPERRRKCRPRLMMRINAKILSKDSWSWRKYGQKPIKGSPYPRNYYRCSTSKACCARKQVELSQDNPDECIVSYIGEHIHARPTARRSAAATAKNLPPPCSAAPIAVTDLSPTTPLIAHDHDQKTQNPDKGNEKEISDTILFEEEEGDLLVPNMQKISEETFVAMHELNSRASPPIVTKPSYPAKEYSVNAVGNSD